jgi:hypothetical protein
MTESGSMMRICRACVKVAVALAVTVATLVLLAGCGPGAETTQPPESQATTQPRPSEPATLSIDNIEYSRGLGGVSHKGEPVLLVVAYTVQTQQEASETLAAMLPSFGDAQVYFTVQRSASFKGLARGGWVVAEAYWTESEASQGLEWATGRGAAEDPLQPTLRWVTVLSDDPIPVVEDVMFDDGLSIEPAVGPLVKVPDVLEAVYDNTYAGDLIDDPEGTADEMRAVARELLLKTGLLSSLEFRSVAQKDEQTPRPGTMVPRGTIVRTRIGIGD